MARILPTLLALLLLAAVPAHAQITNPQVGGFGTQVKLGDADYTPVLKRVSMGVRVIEADFGKLGEVQDNCIVLMNEFPTTDLPGGTFRAPKAAGAAWPLQTKDIMLTPCQGKPAGTLVTDADDVMKTFTWTERIVDVRYADLNGNSRFDKGDAAYVMPVGAAPLLAAAANGLVPSTATGVWTLRITPNAPYAAGTFVKAEDSDIQRFGKIAAGAATAAATPKKLAMSFEEREGGNYYLIPEAPAGADASGSSAGLVAGTPYQFKQQNVPANSIRIGTAGTYTLQPGVVPMAVTFANPDGIETGHTFDVLVTVANSGADAGQGVLMSRLDGRVLDVRLTPKLSPGESTKLLVTLPAPSRGGVQQLEVNELVSTVNVKGSATAPAASSAAPSADLAALQSQIADLQAKVATLQAGGATVKAQGAPSVAPLALLASLVLVALVLRRRGD